MYTSIFILKVYIMIKKVDIRQLANSNDQNSCQRIVIGINGFEVFSQKKVNVDILLPIILRR